MRKTKLIQTFNILIIIKFVFYRQQYSYINIVRYHIFPIGFKFARKTLPKQNHDFTLPLSIFIQFIHYFKCWLIFINRTNSVRKKSLLISLRIWIIFVFSMSLKVWLKRFSCLMQKYGHISIFREFSFHLPLNTLHFNNRSK